MAFVNIIYHHFPHYRAPVLRALARSGRHQYRFWGALTDVGGIKAFRGDADVHIHPLELRADDRTGRLSMSGYWRAVCDPSADALVIIGNPNIGATWVMAIAGRLMGKKVLFWAHGWLRQEPWAKRQLRNIYFRLANRVLVYGNRAVHLAAASGFDPRRVSVIYNSLDWKVAQASDIQAKTRTVADIRGQYGLPLDRRILFCVARLTPLCRFDLLVEAAARLNGGGAQYAIALVGDGPEAAPLRALAEARGVALHLLGSIYDEGVLATLFHAVDLTVSPGKIGLTAMHSLSHGVPAITHGDLDAQMPEVEAIVEGKTGAYFKRDDADSLAGAVDRWFASQHDAEAVASECRRVIAEKYTPEVQVTLIDLAVDEAFDVK